MIKPGRLLRNGLARLQRALAKQRVLVIGDSHAKIFRHWSFLLGMPAVHFQVCAVGGATASGLANPHSRTQAYNRFEAALASHPHDRLLVQLGEVDTGFVIWYRAAKYQAGVEEMLDLAVQTYTEFLSRLGDPGRLLVLSAPLPTIADDNAWGEVADLRKEVTASQQQRTELTLRFNARVAAFCRERGITHVNLDGDALGEDGVVRRDLLHPDRNDHHYHPRRYAALIRARLAPHLAPGGQAG